MNVQERVAKGVEWLDWNVPDWVEKVDLPKFDISSECRCVLGQVFQQEAIVDGAPVWDYGDNKGFADGYAYSRGRMTEPVEYGFDADDYETEEEVDTDYNALQTEWERVIEERKAWIRQTNVDWSGTRTSSGAASSQTKCLVLVNPSMG